MVFLHHVVRALHGMQEIEDRDHRSMASEWKFQDSIPLEGGDRSLFIAMGVIALLSMITSLSLLSFLTYRFIFWKRYYKHSLAQNQYVVLIYNLLLVDLQQGLGFLISLVWASRGTVQFGDAACYLQGWFIQIGDPGSGLFVLAIALHTGAVVLRGRQLPFGIFVVCVVALWVFILILGFIPVGMYGHGSFVVTEANWCWVSPRAESDRLWGHYLWIFISEFGTIVLYAIMFFYLRRRMIKAKMLRQGQQENLRRLNRVVIYMVIYPLVYLVLSLPLAAGRMASAGGDSPSKTYFGIAGCLMAFSGIMDVAVYTLTRRHLLTDTERSTTDHSYENNTDSQWQTQITTTANGIRSSRRPRRKGFFSSRTRRNIAEEDGEISPFEASTDDIVAKSDMEMTDLHGVYQETTIEISHEPAEGLGGSSSSSLDGHQRLST
ncbi:hypothetical protein N7495_000050 [Penicillium taxi]|uniref:uncharacterized protein n=1 Tax=Penicillium taxi TaxID=168475 RepID=UPI002545A8B4|nr:uncharacterized protein N7495_000050 [Penicillium taxi]KAJ5907368.1 hypothetical protein N7495_000050 [Penicillium taxi]